jgi:hypothetical protein
VATLVIETSLLEPPLPPPSSTHLCLMSDQKVTSDDDNSGSGSDSDDELTASTYDELASLLKEYTKVTRNKMAKNKRLKLENKTLLAKLDLVKKV